MIRRHMAMHYYTLHEVAAALDFMIAVGDDPVVTGDLSPKP